MKGIVFTPHLLLRLPAYPVTHYTNDLQSFLDDPFFRAAIYLASPMFYTRIEERDFNIENLSGKQLFTLGKYVNRACFRPTPFGLFSSVSLLQWSADDSIVFNHMEPFSVDISPDQNLVNIVSQIEFQCVKSDRKFEANPTIYRTLNEYRFIKTEVDGEEKRQYRLQSTVYSSMLKSILKFSREGRTQEDIVNFITKQANTGHAEGLDYFSFLIDAQILVSSIRQNISGEDFLLSLARRGNVGPTGDSIASLTRQRLNLQGTAVGQMQIIDQYLKDLKLGLDVSKPAISVILERKLISNKMDLHVQNQIHTGLLALHRLSSKQDVPAMKIFLEAFTKHFEGQRIALLNCLDPEQGIGYQNPAVENPNELLETLPVKHKETSSHISEWTPVHIYLMSCWIAAERDGHTVISLTAEGLKELKGENPEFRTLGLSVLFRRYGDKVYFESAGGTNVCALMGRFTVASPEIAAAASDMAAVLEKENPHILFAELLHLTDPHYDNINRREHIWSYEIPITAASTLPDIQQIELCDLYVEVIDSKVYLWSQKHQKYVIPRLSSAYNHTLNHLPLFRFMVDLGYQYGDSDMTFELRRFFPGLDHYPRVEYGLSILGAATWVLREKDLLPLRRRTDKEAISVFQLLTRSKNIPKDFIWADADHQLRFNQEDPKDVILFLEMIRNRNEVILLEYLGDQNNINSLEDQEGHHFAAQFNAFVIPDKPVPFPVAKTTARPGKLPIRKYMPGTEWLYLKIYTPSLATTKLLVKLWPLIRKKYRNGIIENWFFVRYEDHAPHIRLRFKTDPQNISEILIALKILLGKQVEQYLIREYQINTYSRELERYQAAGIALTEEFFWASSVFTVEHLQKGDDTFPTYLAAIRSVKAIAELFIPDSEALIDYFKHSYEGLAAEFEGTAKQTELDLKYRELRGFIQKACDDHTLYAGNQLGLAYENLLIIATQLSESVTENGNTSYLNSILHLHLNRLFTDQQRKQEMVIYYMLYKHTKSEMARNKTGAH